MGRPKGSKNKKTIAREARSKAMKKVAKSRGPRKTYARPLKKKKEEVLDTLSTPQFDELQAHVKTLMEVQVKAAGSMQMCLSSMKIVIEALRAGFLDSWRQYIEHMMKADQEPKPATFIKLFGHQATVLGFSEADLMPYLDTEPTIRTTITPPSEQPTVAPVTEAPVHHEVNGVSDLDRL